MNAECYEYKAYRNVGLDVDGHQHHEGADLFYSVRWMKGKGNQLRGGVARGVLFSSLLVLFHLLAFLLIFSLSSIRGGVGGGGTRSLVSSLVMPLLVGIAVYILLPVFQNPKSATIYILSYRYEQGQIMADILLFVWHIHSISFFPFFFLLLPLGLVDVWAQVWLLR